jgi:hypothetical protein
MTLISFDSSKHDADSSVRAIRKNLKDMKTTDMTWANEETEDSDHMQSVAEQVEPDDVHMTSFNEKKRGSDEVYEHATTTDTTDIENDASNVNADVPIPPASPRKKPTRRDTADIELSHEQNHSESEKEEKPSEKKGSMFAQFAGKSNGAPNGDDWDDITDDSETVASTKPSSQEKAKPQPKYAFGSSSGFGTKGWGATHQTAPVPGGLPFGSTGKVGHSLNLWLAY